MGEKEDQLKLLRQMYGDDLDDKNPEDWACQSRAGEGLDSEKSYYAGDWIAISQEYRESVGFTCDSCGVCLREAPHLLHTHHLTRNKQNNAHYNLQALCALCHSLQHGHVYLASKLAKAETAEIMRLRKEQQKA